MADRLNAQDRTVSRFRPAPPKDDPVYVSVPDDGLCLNAFLVDLPTGRRDPGPVGDGGPPGAVERDRRSDRTTDAGAFDPMDATLPTALPFRIPAGRGPDDRYGNNWSSTRSTSPAHRSSPRLGPAQSRPGKVSTGTFTSCSGGNGPREESCTPPRGRDWSSTIRPAWIGRRWVAATWMCWGWPGSRSHPSSPFVIPTSDYALNPRTVS